MEFASAASASAVCSFCRSTLLRDGEALRRIGVSAELFDDHSPLQLGAGGVYQGRGFTLVGRQQFAYAAGTWSEWHALFDGGEEPGKSAWLSEDNGAYVFSFDQPPITPAPRVDDFGAGSVQLLRGDPWTVASVQKVTVRAAEGELPRPPRLDGAFTVVDLRSPRGEVGTLEWSDPKAPQWALGRAVRLADLGMSGLREGAAEQGLAGQQLPCPSCGAPLQPTLASTRSIVCGQCKAVVDVSNGVGADLEHYAQRNAGASGIEPEIPLGKTGRLALDGGPELDWQVVGYQERCDIPDEDDHATFWREFLLYNRKEGFAFLVSDQQGWSLVRPLAGVPELRLGEAVLDGRSYREGERYSAKVTYVLGEFYWRVQQGEVAGVTDYASKDGRQLSREETPGEVVWSAGRRLGSDAVARAFGMGSQMPQARSRDSAPLSGLSSSSSSLGLSQGVIILIVVVFVMMLMTQCSDDSCKNERAAFGEASAEYQQCRRNHSSGGFRSSGGSFGGFSSGGGGHK